MLSVKWKRQYSQMAHFVQTQMCLAVVRSNTLLLRGDCMLSWRRRAPDDGAGARASMAYQID